MWQRPRGFCDWNHGYAIGGVLVVSPLSDFEVVVRPKRSATARPLAGHRRRRGFRRHARSRRACLDQASIGAASSTTCNRAASLRRRQPTDRRPNLDYLLQGARREIAHASSSIR